jgi:hypothetical protein
MVVLVASALLWSRTRHSAAGTPVATGPQASVGAAFAAAGAASSVALPAEIRVPRRRAGPPIEVAPGPAPSLRPAQVLARVNGTPITGKDLIAFRAGLDELSIDRPTYNSLLGRAIERELTFEAAKKQGVTLTEEQRGQLDEVRKQAAARGGTTPPFDRSSDEVDFEARDAQAQMLLTDLLEKAGTPPPSPTPADVDSYYRAHANELGALPEGEARAAAWAKIEIEIRRRLLSEQQETWRARRQEMLDSLEAEANVSY